MIQDRVMIDVAGEQLELMGQRAVHWKAQRTVFIADLHLGKAASFRASGIAAPEGTTTRDLVRLSGIVHETRAERLIILGDLLHAQSGRSMAVLDAVAAWRGEHTMLEIVLVRGNHDRRAGDPPTPWEVRCIDPGATTGPFELHHEPDEAMMRDARQGDYALCGHVHPAILATDRGGLSKRDGRRRLPAFLVGETRFILPSFGAFTGVGRVRPSLSDRVFVVIDEEAREGGIAEVPVRVRLASSM